MNQPSRDLLLNGVGKAMGGRYDSVLIDGIGTVNGDIVCDHMTGNGTIKVNGGIQAGDLTLNGTGSLRGPLNCGSIRADGLLNIGGEVHFGSLDMNGMLKVEAGARGERVEVNGTMKLGGDLQCETLKIYGNLQVGGLLNADQVHIELFGSCSAREIGGEQITIRRRSGEKKLIEFFSVGLYNKLSVDVIEGDEIELENTKAKIVRGNRVRIGPGCEINRVEYKQFYEVHPKADVSQSMNL